MNDISRTGWKPMVIKNISCSFSLNTNMNCNEIVFFYVWTRSNEIEGEWTILTVHEWEQMIFIVWEWVIFSVCEWGQMRLWYAHFKDLMINDLKSLRNDWELTGMNGKILFMTVNDWYHPFLFAIHERLGAKFSKTILFC